MLLKLSRRREALVLTLCAATMLWASPTQAAQRFVVSPAAQSIVERVLANHDFGQLGEVVAVDVKPDRFLITVSDKQSAEPNLAVTLRHPALTDGSVMVLPTVAILPFPGPVPKRGLKVLRDVFSSLNIHALWQPASDGAMDAPSDDEEYFTVMRLLAKAEHAYHVGQVEQAIADLEALSKQEGYVRIAELALAESWLRVGQPKRAHRAVNTWRLGQRKAPSALMRWRARALLGKPIDLERARAEMDDEGDLCAAKAVAEALYLAGQAPQALELVSTLWLEHRCVKAATRQVSWLVDKGELDTAESLAKTLIADHGDVEEVRGEAARVAMAQGKPKVAFDHLSKVSQGDPSSGLLSALIGASQRAQDEEWLLGQREIFMTRYRADKSDSVAAFLAGVCLHYEGQWAESDALLAEVEGIFGDQPRLHIYRGMNAFNLGDTNEAGRRMDAAGALDAFDPDVYYCRAEILRFTDPPAAAEQLKRYLATTEGSPTANVAKQTRVKRMLELLDRCISSDAPIPCQGPWEHPRGHEANVDPDVKDSGYIDPDSPPNGWRDQLWWVTSLIGAVILGSIVAMRRRKTRT